MFVGRENELKELNAAYSSNRFEMAIVYGRRRVGKTTLLTHFAKDKKPFISQLCNNLTMITSPISAEK